MHGTLWLPSRSRGMLWALDGQWGWGVLELHTSCGRQRSPRVRIRLLQWNALTSIARRFFLKGTQWTKITIASDSYYQLLTGHSCNPRAGHVPG